MGYKEDIIALSAKFHWVTGPVLRTYMSWALARVGLLEKTTLRFYSPYRGEQSEACRISAPFPRPS